MSHIPSKSQSIGASFPGPPNHARLVPGCDFTSRDAVHGARWRLSMRPWPGGSFRTRTVVRDTPPAIRKPGRILRSSFRRAGSGRQQRAVHRAASANDVFDESGGRSDECAASGVQGGGSGGSQRTADRPEKPRTRIWPTRSSIGATTPCCWDFLPLSQLGWPRWDLQRDGVRVEQRTREIGIQMARGAGGRDVLKLIFGHAVVVIAIGAAVATDAL